MARLRAPHGAVGFWSAVLTAVASIGFLVGATVSAVILPPNTWSGDPVAYARSFDARPMIVTVVPSLVIAPSFLVLVAAIHGSAPPERRHWSLVAFAAATIYAAIVITNYYLQLSLVRTSIEGGRAGAVALLIMDDPRGAFWPIELLAYGVQGLASAAAALAFAPHGLQRAIRWSLGAVGLGGVLSLLAGVRGTYLADPIFIAGGALWGVALPLAGLLCAVYFRRSPGALPRPDDASPCG